MGTKNAATVAQNAYTSALHYLLAKESQNHIAGITLNPEKISFGIKEAIFYGYKLNNGRIEPTTRNLDPVIKMTTPKTRSELRSVMGIFNQFAPFIVNYGRKTSDAKIISSLLSTKVPYIWTPNHERAFQNMRKLLLSGKLYLHIPDHTIPLHLDRW